MRRIVGALLIAWTAAVSVPGCALLVSFDGLDDGGAADKSPDAGAHDVGGMDDRQRPPLDGVAAEDSTGDAGVPRDAAGERAGNDASFVYLGCFADSTTRDLPDASYSSAVNTTEACIAFCAYHAYRYAGTQNGYQCYCGDAYGGQGPAGNCHTPCAGDSTEICGGGYENSVYLAAGAPPPKATYIGCYVDDIRVADTLVRDLPHLAYENAYNTVESCTAACAYHGYLYAGVEDGLQCFCGNAYGGQGPASGCTMACTGNASESCGASGKEGVYRTWIPAD